VDASGDEYAVLAARAEASLTVRGSRFLALAVPVRERGGCEEELAGRRKSLHDATHHPFAYRLGEGGSAWRAVDDGEPAGSAGRPILAAIDGAGLSDVLVVVTRYFGGTKLGVGGLARAYREAAGAALARGGRAVRVISALIDVAVAHERVGPAMHAIAGAGGKILSSRYDAEVLLAVEIRRSRLEGLRAALQEATRGAIRISAR